MRFLRVATVLVALMLAVLLPPGSVVSAGDGEGEEERGEAPHDPPARREVEGRVWLPTLIAVRPFTPMSMNGITHYYIPDVRPGAPFQIESLERPAVNVPCVAVCAPDFDVVFYGATSSDGFEHVAGRFSGEGDESGRVPMGALFALVFLRGPNLPPDPFGSSFVYRER